MSISTWLPEPNGVAAPPSIAARITELVEVL
jgi:hypothetical protein